MLCAKAHLDTFHVELAHRYDNAVAAWHAARAAKHQEAQPLGPCTSEAQPLIAAAAAPREVLGSVAPYALAKKLFLEADYAVPAGIYDAPWYYDEKWYSRASVACLLCTATCLAATALWPCTPRLRRYRELHPDERVRFAEHLGRRLGAAITEHGEPAVLCIEKPYLDGFVVGLAESVGVPFVLLAVNGGDAPVTQELQDRIAAVPHLRACFANNLHVALRPEVFLPMPIGLPHHSDGLHRGRLRGAGEGEAAIDRTRQAARPWELRDSRLLVTPMSGNRLRGRFLDVLSQPEYRHLVRIVKGRMDYEAFLNLLAEHRCALSPPGKGFDCYRTWQAIAVGTAPIVVEDATFDMRLFSDWGLPAVPVADCLTPGSLELALGSATDPKDLYHRLGIDFWSERWSSFLR